MQLIGLFDSPYVRRVAISMKLMEIGFERRPLSVFRHFDEFAGISPVVKAPSLVLDDGEVLIDSNMILQYLEEIAAPGKSLLPADPEQRRRALRLIGLALAACEKGAQSLYETMLRPPDKQHRPWIDRVEAQMRTAYAVLESEAARAGPWFFGDRLTQADITTAVAWRFARHAVSHALDLSRYPALTDLSARAEQLPVFIDSPLD